MSGWRLRAGFAALLVAACALPEVEIDPTLGGAGSGAGGGSAGSNDAGRGGSGGRGGTGAAGKGGGGTAGTLSVDPREEACNEYCSTYVDACAGHEANSYDDALDCSVVCNSSDWPFGTDLTEVNSVQCRLAHAKLARDAGRDPHCFHAAEVPTGTSCAPPQ